MMTFKKKIISALIRPDIILIKGRPGQKRVALTFDDGPDPRFTPQVLDILKREGVPATFFMVGNNIEKHKEIALRIIAEGHTIGWHSREHKGYQDWGYKRWADDLVRGRELFRKLLNQECRYFRPPRGIFSLRHILFCRSQKITTVLWSKDSLDYKLKTSSRVLDNINTNGIYDGDVWLFHDDNELIIDVLPRFIEMCRRENLKFVNIGDYLQ